MKLQRRNNLLFVAICLLAIVYSGAGSGTLKEVEAAPSVGSCCTFDTLNCADSTYWYWSATNPAPIPSPSGDNYLWASSDGAQAQFPTTFISKLGNYFTLDYYIANPLDYLRVDFIPNGGTPFLLGILRYDPINIWVHVGPDTLTCSNFECCAGFSSCDGNLVITSYIGVSENVAVDNVYVNGGCF
ncbi:hypothetical protein CHUAL_012062 [Chamberlinius hualienensis]